MKDKLINKLNTLVDELNDSNVYHLILTSDDDDNGLLSSLPKYDSEEMAELLTDIGITINQGYHRNPESITNLIYFLCLLGVSMRVIMPGVGNVIDKITEEFEAAQAIRKLINEN